MRDFFCLTLAFSAQLAFAQDKATVPEVTYEQLYDEPYTVNKLFVGFQPLYGEMFATNVNAGFGVDAHYYYKQTADFRAHFRHSYTSGFFDLNRENALKNSSVQNDPAAFSYFEFGMTWHVKDFDDQSKTKLVLYKKNYHGNLWAAQVPQHIVVPCKVRKIYGARLGGILWNSSLDFTNALQQAEMTNLDFAGGVFDNSYSLFTNIHSAGIYAGGSLTRIKNIAVGFDEFEGALDDGMLTLFADILYAPYLKVDDITYQGNQYVPTILKLNSFGFRVGLDGKFNRKLSWGYGGELGYRPSVDHLGFFATVKIAIPLYGTNLDYKVQAVNKSGL